MATEYSPAPKEVIKIAEGLVSQHDDVENLDLGFVMRSEAAVSKGHRVLAKVYKPPAWSDAFNLNYDLIIELPEDIWKNLVSHQREALIDFALCHIDASWDEKKGETVFRLISPDIQVFRRNLQDYGLWWPEGLSDASAFEKARQIKLPGMEKKGKIESVDPGAAKKLAAESDLA